MIQLGDRESKRKEKEEEQDCGRDAAACSPGEIRLVQALPDWTAYTAEIRLALEGTASTWLGYN